MSLKFPRLFALPQDQQGPVCQAWQEAWAPALPTALSNQWADDLIRMQKLLGDCQLSDGPNAWVWQEPRFSTRAVYQRLREQVAMEDPTFLWLWRAAWKSRLLLKIRILAWLLLRIRLKMRAFLHRVIPNVLASCALCAGAEETCEHLLITCPVSSSIWQRANVDRLDISSWEAFWRSFGAGKQRLSAEWQRLFSILWSIWGHRNEVIFRERIPSVDAIQHDARGLEQSWYPSGSGQSTYVSL